MTEPLNPEVAILNAALELPPSERAAYLDQACAGDPTLRKQVDALLHANEQAEDFLEAPPAGLNFQRTARVNIAPTEKPGDKIGRYKLLQQIGEGGCGVVYMAEQEEPVRRRVALKVIKIGMDTKQVIARFEAERQALALMDHPNIAKVLDAGATDTGRPFFVMELVRGIKITDFCDDNNLPTADRLQLFIQVCRAIQHAHQKGVIHRDIKPSNILVTVNDGVPVPKVIDFGIAKATAGRLTDHTLFTAFEQFIGTPAYMSPEQAVLTSLDIDTRSDIYSLGVLLYELLTGRTPFDQRELLAAGLDEMRRTILEKEPARPSTRLNTLLAADLTTIATHRHTDAPKLIHLLLGDLDWIVMKSLDKDRARRYETANGLAMDIERHLHDEPVIARPPSRLYEFQKTVRRHKFGFAAGSAIIVVSMIGVVVSTSQAIRASRAEREQILARRVDFFARQGRWKEALAGATKVVELDPGEHLNYHTLAPLQAQVGDLKGYRKTCQQAVARFRGTEDPSTAERMAKDCLLLPDSGVDLSAVSAWADTAVTAGKDSGELPWFQFCKGLAEYRQEHFASAVDWMQKVLSHAGINLDRDAEAYLVLAMAQHRSKQSDEARAALAKGVEIVETKLPKLESGDVGNWIDWIIAHALMREAKALLEGQANTPAEKKPELR